MMKRSSMKGPSADSEVITPVVRWLARALGVVLAAGIVAFGLFDAWAALIVNLIHGGGGLESGGPGILGVLEWTAVFVGILIAFFWEGIGGAIVALVALAMQVDVIVNAGGGLNPYILVFVFDGLAFVSVGGSPGGALAACRRPKALPRYHHPSMSVASSPTAGGFSRNSP